MRPIDQVRAMLKDLIGGPDSTILVAAERGAPLLGLATVIVKHAAASSVRDARSFAEIDNLVVREGARRRGVARALVDASIAWAQGRNVRSLEVSVWRFNVGAADFYREIGFEPATERLVMTLPGRS